MIASKRANFTCIPTAASSKFNNGHVDVNQEHHRPNSSINGLRFEIETLAQSMPTVKNMNLLHN